MQRISSLCSAALLLGVFFVSGCDTAVITNGNILGIQSGQFLYESGYLQAVYPHPIDKVWQACEQTLQELHATTIVRDRKIASGKLTANIYEDKIILNVEYVDNNRTAVSVLAGIGGNQLAARLIHEKIGQALSSSGAANAAQLSVPSIAGESKQNLISSETKPVVDRNEEKEVVPLDDPPIIDKNEERDLNPLKEQPI